MERSGSMIHWNYGTLITILIGIFFAVSPEDFAEKFLGIYISIRLPQLRGNTQNFGVVHKL